MTTTTQSIRNFTSYSSFFMYVSAITEIKEKHFIGFSTSGKKDDVLVKSLRCSVEVIEPDTYGLVSEPRLRITWTVTYSNWSKSKGDWSKREVTHEINKNYLDNIISLPRQIELESELVTRLGNKINNGVKAIYNSAYKIVTENN